MRDQNLTSNKRDFTPNVTQKIKTVRAIANEFDLGERIKQKGKKKHIETELLHPRQESSYQFNYLDFKIQDKLIFGHPQLPVYSLKWRPGDSSSYKKTND